MKIGISGVSSSGLSTGLSCVHSLMSHDKKKLKNKKITMCQPGQVFSIEKSTMFREYRLILKILN